MATRQGKRRLPPSARNTGHQRLLIAVAAVVVVAIAATAVVTRPAPATAQACAPTSASIGTGVGQCAPNFTLDNVQGKSVSLSNFHGHPVLIHFWAVGCTTCAAEYPDFSRIVRAYVPKGLVVLAVDAWGEQPALIRRWQDAHHLPANFLVDEPQAVVRQYGAPGTPTTFFIDRTGHITASNSGPLSFGDYQKNLARIV